MIVMRKTKKNWNELKYEV